VIAFIGAKGAVMAGDTREIMFCGDADSTGTLERELYGGRIVTDADLLGRAEELKIRLSIRDDKRKVTQRDGVLVGEVSESEGGEVRIKRLYATAGEYAVAEITGSGFRLTGSGRAGSFVVLGNQVTKETARACIRETWNAGTIHDAIRTIMLAMERASAATASVSGLYNLVQTPEKADLAGAIGKDRGE
jgi:hypothetical protein